MSTDTFDIGGNATISFSFDTIGATVTGKVLALDEIQQTDIASGQPVFWPDGQPKMHYRVNLQTELRDPGNLADDGKRSVYLRGSRKSETQSSLAAVLDAVRAATNDTALSAGGTLTLTYIADGARTQAGFNPPKRYQASYQPPTVNLEPAFSTPQPAPAPIAPPPVQQPSTPQPASQYTPEQVAALKAAGIDPATLNR